MRAKAVLVFIVLAVLSTSTAAMSQEGHPLAGSWYGEWGPGAQGNQVFVFLSWDGSDVTGFMMNPGPERTPLTIALDSSEWRVRLEATAEDNAGNPIRYVADGVLENIGSRNRTLSGTWSQDGTDYTFALTREN